MKDHLRGLVGALNKVFITHRKAMLQKSQLYGLYVGQPQILTFIKDNPGCTQNEIAENIGVSPASIAFSTKRLQKAGLLQKQVNSLNMRCNRLYVTPEGIETLEKFGEDFDSMNQIMFDGFSEEELHRLAEFAGRVTANLEKILKEG